MKLGFFNSLISTRFPYDGGATEDKRFSQNIWDSTVVAASFISHANPSECTCVLEEFLSLLPPPEVDGSK